MGAGGALEYDAIVLAGGAARRLGGADKPGLEVGGTSLLARVLAAVSDAGRVVVVGPPRAVPGDVIWCCEEPRGGGPVAAVAAGLLHTIADVVVVLAADLPFVGGALPALRAAADTAPAAFLVDRTGPPNYLAGAWQRPALQAALDRVGAPSGASMRSLVDTVAWAAVPDDAGWGRDCDTWDEVAAARAAQTAVR